MGYILSTQAGYFHADPTYQSSTTPNSQFITLRDNEISDEIPLIESEALGGIECLGEEADDHLQLDNVIDGQLPVRVIADLSVHRFEGALALARDEPPDTLLILVVCRIIECWGRIDVSNIGHIFVGSTWDKTFAHTDLCGFHL